MVAADASNAVTTQTDTTSTEPVKDLRPIQTKLVLLGESAVGKTSVVHRFVQDEFQENREPTIGAAFLTVCTLAMVVLLTLKATMPSGRPYHQVRNLGYSRPGTFPQFGAYVLPQRTSQRCGV